MSCQPPLQLRDRTGWHWLRLDGTHVDRPYPWVADTQSWGAPIRATPIAATKRGFTYVGACTHAPVTSASGADAITDEIADTIAVATATPQVIVKRVIAAYLGSIPLDERGRQLVLFTADRLRLGFIDTIERWRADQSIALATGDAALAALADELRKRGEPPP
jgi:hypothetical protein